MRNIPLFYPPGDSSIFVSGGKGKGKTTTTQVICEGFLIDGAGQAAVVIHEPTMQYGRLGLKADKLTLPLFKNFSINTDLARGFNVKIFTPDYNVGLPLPEDLTELFTGCNIISTIEVSDKRRLEIYLDILRAVKNYFKRETNKARILLVYDEAHVLVSENVEEEARNVSKTFLSELKRIERETRKFGVNFCFTTHSVLDFAYKVRSIRGNISTRIFHRSDDETELKWIETYTNKESGKIVKTLKRGEVVISNPDIYDRPIKVAVRPPFSKVGPISDEDIRQINRRSSPPVEINTGGLKEDELDGLELIKTYCDENNSNMMLAQEWQRQLGLSNGTRERWIKKYYELGLIEKTTIASSVRGRPSLGLIPI